MEDGGSVFKKMEFQYIVQANDMASYEPDVGITRGLNNSEVNQLRRQHLQCGAPKIAKLVYNYNN